MDFIANSIETDTVKHSVILNRKRWRDEPESSTFSMLRYPVGAIRNPPAGQQYTTAGWEPILGQHRGKTAWLTLEQAKVVIMETCQ